MSDNSSDPNAWLGLLKWSLAYTDGTKDSSPNPMSPEDKAFLEKVMKEGIINEGDRMKEILSQVANQFESWSIEAPSSEQEDQVNDLLEELRDIVEQIDYARAFSAMSGLQFILGFVQQEKFIPESTRLLGFGLLSTLCQNNPPVQEQLLGLGSLKVLSDLFFAANRKVKPRILQAISANVRSNELGEGVYCQLDQAVPLLEQALTTDKDDTALIQRGLFFLRALITSDASTRERVRKFNVCICAAADMLPSSDQRISELVLELLCEVLRQKLSVNAVYTRKQALVSKGVERVAALRKLSGEDKEFAGPEMELWENLIRALAHLEPDIEEAPLMLQNGSIEDPQTLASQ